MTLRSNYRQLATKASKTSRTLVLVHHIVSMVIVAMWTLCYTYPLLSCFHINIVVRSIWSYAMQVHPNLLLMSLPLSYPQILRNGCTHFKPLLLCCHVFLPYITGYDTLTIHCRIQTTCSHASRC